MPRRAMGDGGRRLSAVALLRVGLPLAGLALGVTAVTLGGEWAQSPLVWGLDILVGTAYFALAGRLWSSPPREAVLAFSVGVCWFLGTFIVPWADYWHRAPLIHLVLLVPLARSRTWQRRAVLIAAYLVSTLPAFWQSDAIAITAATGIAVIAWFPGRRWRRVGRPHWFARWSALILSASIIAGVIMKAVMSDAGLAVLLQYEVALLLVAMFLALSRKDVREGALTDLVVDLEDTPSDALTAALAAALGDPRLRIGYWNAPDAEYQDLKGRSVTFPGAGTGMSTTAIQRDGERFAILVHAISLEGDPRLLAAISSATLLTAANTELQAVARARVADIEASRLRLVVAADQELLVLARRLDAEISAPIRELGRAIQEHAATSPAAEPTLTATAGQLLDVVETLDATVLGLPPKELDSGLRSAFAALAARSPIPLELDASAARFAPEVESALYLTAAEAVTNAIKHASATSIRLTLSLEAAAVVVRIEDDGCGGASFIEGTGIAGIADRLAALGGRIEIDSPRGGGTRVTATLPGQLS